MNRKRPSKSAHLHLLKSIAIAAGTLVLIVTATIGCKRDEGAEAPEPVADSETNALTEAPPLIKNGASAEAEAESPLSPSPFTNANVPSIAGPNPLNPTPPDFRLVRVFYATDRNMVHGHGRNPIDVYSNGRGDVTYGTCLASIPYRHDNHENHTGEFELPPIMKYQFRADPATHVVLLDVYQLSKSNYFDTMRTRIQRSASKSAFLFVHGYNVTFDDAARRTAEISFELSFDGAPVFFTWPSQGTLVGYPTDEANVEWSEIDLENFLEDFVANSGADNIYLIAHSMGNRALTRAFAALISLKPEVRGKFKQLILTAPDIDADVFRREIAPLILSTNFPLVTLYVSSTDEALKLSKQFHTYQRLGDPDPLPVILPNMDTIDVSAVDSDLLGHSYAFTERTVLSDIFNLIQNAAPLSQKPRLKLSQVGLPPAQYWQYKP
jgi:esterase/lipase superfamily enzyme